MFDTILFDLDGTLTDPFKGIANSVIYALKKFGITAPDKPLGWSAAGGERFTCMLRPVWIRLPIVRICRYAPCSTNG